MVDDGKNGGGFGGGESGIGEPGGDPIGGVGSDAGVNVASVRAAEGADAEECERRALTAEQKVADLESKLAQARETIDAVERRHAIDMALVEADAIDLESARLLTELAVSQMSEKDVGLAVSDLRRRKPFLFRERAGATLGAAMGAHGAPPNPADAARDEAKSGDRRALLRYLRARRAG